MDSTDAVSQRLWSILDTLAAIPLWLWMFGLVVSLFGIFVLFWTCFPLLAPPPRPPRSSEKHFITTSAGGSASGPQRLPCWFDKYVASKETAKDNQSEKGKTTEIEPAEVVMSLVIPAYNEEQRLNEMLVEAVDYLEECYGPCGIVQQSVGNGTGRGRGGSADAERGWEIILVSDGSTDKTVQTALDFTKSYQRQIHSEKSGAPNGRLQHGGITSGTVRIVQLEENRGKGGAVTHGMRHVRGAYVVFADADGASKFSDLGKLVAGCEEVKDSEGRAVGVGSRAHMVGTEAVVKRSLLRNTLMRAFHLLIRTLTTTKTGQIKDTQCGFKLFTRPALPYIIPFMHSEGWIFDVEMLMLAESADIPMVEVPIGWKEVTGSKLNVIKDSIGMAIGLALLRIGWGLGIYRRD